MTNESRRVYKVTTTELIIACSSWRQWATPYHGCSHRGIVTNRRQQQQRRGWNVWGSPATTSESSESPATAAAMLMFALKGKYKKSDRCPLFTTWTVAMLCCVNQWSISLHSSSVWRPIKLPPFASVRRFICPWQVGALRKRREIGLWLLWGVDRK